MTRSRVTLRKACARLPGGGASCRELRRQRPSGVLRPNHLSLTASVVLLGLILGDVEPQPACGQMADRRQDRVARDDDVALGADQIDLRGDDVGLRVEHVERGALADLALLDDAAQRQFGGSNQVAVGRHAFLRGGELRPGRDYRVAHLVARDVDLDARLAERFLGLAHLRRDAPALVDRHRER